MKTFVPIEAADEVRHKIHNIKQRGTIADYNASFRRLAMQIDTDFLESRYAYLKGLTPKIRDQKKHYKHTRPTTRMPSTGQRETDADRRHT